MSGNIHPVCTKDQPIAEFAPTVPPINREINLRELMRIWEHVKTCAQAKTPILMLKIICTLYASENDGPISQQGPTQPYQLTQEPIHPMP